MRARAILDVFMVDVVILSSSYVQYSVSARQKMALYTYVSECTVIIQAVNQLVSDPVAIKTI